VKYLFLIIAVSFTTVACCAEWPARVFAPYMYVGAGDHLHLTECDDACHQKFYTLAFIIADRTGAPAWDGRFPLQQNLFANDITAIRSRGGDVIVSFGGADGVEIGIAETNTAALAARYQSIIDRYQLTWLDFDIEGDSLAKTNANARRDFVLAALQKTNPGLRITFTLPVDPNGISDDSQKMLADASAQGVKVFSANVMTMDFGRRFSKGKKMSDVSIASVLKAHEQCLAIDPAIKMGVTAMIGQNDVHTEVFSQTDAQALELWAEAQPWICSLSFWASNRDAGRQEKGKNENITSGISQKPWEFTLIFQPFMKSH
jgi:chitinase